MKEENNNLQKEDISFILLTHKDFLENIKGAEFNTYAKLITISKINHIRAKSNQLSFFTLIAYLLIIAIGVILYFF